MILYLHRECTVDHIKVFLSRERALFEMVGRGRKRTEVWEKSSDVKALACKGRGEGGVGEEGSRGWVRFVPLACMAWLLIKSGWNQYALVHF